jgi:hypothetical protein
MPQPVRSLHGETARRNSTIEGTLDIRSTPGGGTCLTITVPLPKEPAAEVTTAEKLG